MLATSTPSAWQYTHTYAPHRPSPLSPRSANINARPLQYIPAPDFMCAKLSVLKDAEPQSKNSGTHAPVPFSKRPVKANPVLRDRDRNRERRRDIFLKKVEKERDEKRWEGRGEQIMKLDFVSQQRRWEAEQARAAPPAADALEYFESSEDNGAYMLSSEGQDWRSQNRSMNWSSSDQPYGYEADEAEAIIQQEDRELDALISLMPAEETRSETQREEDSSHYGSDDEEYQNIFMDYLGEEGQAQSYTSARDFWDQEEDAMDTSNG